MPATASVGALVQVVGEGFAGCVAADGDVASSRSGDASLAATGDVSLRWEGIGPVAIIHLDEEFGFSANLEIVNSIPPGDHRPVSRCVDNDGDDEAGDDGGDEAGTGSADFTVTPLPELVAAGPDGNPVEGTTAGLATSALDAALAAPDDQDGAGTSENSSASSDEPIPAENDDNGSIGAEPALPDTRPMSWGLLVGALILLGAVAAIVLSIPVVLKARRGPKWVHKNVRAVAQVAPAMSVALAPQTAGSWPPTSVVRFALHADSGTQTITEVKQ